MQSQQRAELYGRVVDTKGQPIELANVAVVGKAGGTVTDINGSFLMPVRALDTLIVAASLVGYEKQQDTLILKAGEKRSHIFVLKVAATMLETTVIEDKSARST
ncbi:MAG: carboxypeptidase-like regulatory domain-containing protein, partial [Bacteroidales bacterium]|nr:carboxypeptidase-like regulatory domain-containing protein [Bacteroidales bacterium]